MYPLVILLFKIAVKLVPDLSVRGLSRCFFCSSKRLLPRSLRLTHIALRTGVFVKASQNFKPYVLDLFHKGTVFFYCLAQLLGVLEKLFRIIARQLLRKLRLRNVAVCLSKLFNRVVISAAALCHFNNLFPVRLPAFGRKRFHLVSELVRCYPYRLVFPRRRNIYSLVRYFSLNAFSVAVHNAFRNIHLFPQPLSHVCQKLSFIFIKLRNILVCHKPRAVLFCTAVYLRFILAVVKGFHIAPRIKACLVRLIPCLLAYAYVVVFRRLVKRVKIPRIAPRGHKQVVFSLYAFFSLAVRVIYHLKGRSVFLVNLHRLYIFRLFCTLALFRLFCCLRACFFRARLVRLFLKRVVAVYHTSALCPFYLIKGHTLLCSFFVKIVFLKHLFGVVHRRRQPAYKAHHAAACRTAYARCNYLLYVVKDNRFLRLPAAVPLRFICQLSQRTLAFLPHNYAVGYNVCNLRKHFLACFNGALLCRVFQKFLSDKRSVFPVPFNRLAHGASQAYGVACF